MVKYHNFYFWKFLHLVHLYHTVSKKKIIYSYSALHPDQNKHFKSKATISEVTTHLDKSWQTSMVDVFSRAIWSSLVSSRNPGSCLAKSTISWTDMIASSVKWAKRCWRTSLFCKSWLCGHGFWNTHKHTKNAHTDKLLNLLALVCIQTPKQQTESFGLLWIAQMPKAKPAKHIQEIRLP